jgi:hypothetical protein
MTMVATRMTRLAIPAEMASKIEYLGGGDRLIH